MKLPTESKGKFITFPQIKINIFVWILVKHTSTYPLTCRDPEIKPNSISHLTKSTCPHHSML